jgi:hypothetical protein
MKTEYVERKNYKDAAKILTQKSSYSKKEYVSLLVEQGDDFRALKKIYFKPTEEDQALITSVILPKLDLQCEILITDYTKKSQDVMAKKARLKVVQDMKRDNVFVIVKERNIDDRWGQRQVRFGQRNEL